MNVQRLVAIAALLLGCSNATAASGGFAWDHSAPPPDSPWDIASARSTDGELVVNVTCGSDGTWSVFLESGSENFRRRILQSGGGNVVDTRFTISGEHLPLSPTAGMAGVGTGILEFSEEEEAALLSAMQSGGSMMSIDVLGSRFTVGMVNYRSTQSKMAEHCAKL